jgi:hypothetical protein
MKKIIINIMFTTGASLVILAVFFVIINEKSIVVKSVLEIFGANILINLGLFIRHRFEIRNVILEFMADVSYIIVILTAFWAIFDWHTGVPLWFLFITAVVIYIFATITAIAKIRKETKEINELLQKRKDKNGDSAS